MQDGGVVTVAMISRDACKISIESNSQDFFSYCPVHQHGRRDVTRKPRKEIESMENSIRVVFSIEFC